jgi:hypothetical protein
MLKEEKQKSETPGKSVVKGRRLKRIRKFIYFAGQLI